MLLQMDGEQMSLQMVDADQRQAGGRGERLRHLHPDQQRADQPRAAGHGDAGQIAQLAAGATERFVRHRQRALQVVARGELRHHAPILRVEGGLGVHHVREDPAAGALARRPVHLHHRGGGLVTARLQAQHAHGSCLRGFSCVRDAKARRPSAAGGSYLDRFATMARTSPANSPWGSSSR